MQLHDALLEQAGHLAMREPKRPKQASLRRAVSTAYYALFHLLTFEAARLIIEDAQAANLWSRAYQHADLRISQKFKKGTTPKRLDDWAKTRPIPDELRTVAKAFVELQEARHLADYDLNARFTRSEALEKVDLAAEAFEKWKPIRKHDWTRIYLSCFSLWKQWDKDYR